MSPLVQSLVVPLLAGVLLAVACGGSDSPSVRIEPAATSSTAAAGGDSSQPAPGDTRKTVFIDAGHGGSDPGWGASFVLPGLPLEKDLNLDLAKRTAAYLEAAGYRVVMSRTEDADVNDPERDVNGDGCTDPIDELQARMDMANASGAAVLFSIHLNGLPGTQLSGSGTYYNAVRDFGDKNKRLAELIQAAQLETLATFGHEARDWGALRDDSFDTPSQSECPTGYKYYTLIGPSAAGRPRPTMMPGVIAEVLFLTYRPEAELIARTEVRDALARSYAEALEEFLTNEQGSALPPASGTNTAAFHQGRTSAPSSRVATRVSTGPARLVDRGPGERKEVALTFDAGAGPGYTAAILEILARKGVKATFGLTGAWCEANAELARRMTAAGHAIINHSFSHASWTGLSPGTRALTAEQRQEEIDRAERAIEQATGDSGRPYYRSPFGDQDDSVQRDLGAMGYRYNVLWSFDSQAWRGATAEEIVAKGIKAAAPGAIYIFHVAEQQDALALERLIEGVAAAGYDFVTVPQLLPVN
jgi:peptidoglycan/xylan/chitin deacetylase (PgdA/CDA1 family)/N-acetylmuramoyl-L-alanine amidase